MALKSYQPLVLPDGSIMFNILMTNGGSGPARAIRSKLGAIVAPRSEPTPDVIESKPESDHVIAAGPNMPATINGNVISKADIDCVVANTAYLYLSGTISYRAGSGDEQGVTIFFLRLYYDGVEVKDGREYPKFGASILGPHNDML